MNRRTHSRQHGMALISGLLLLLVVTILGVSMFRSFGIQARIAGNTREKQRALHTAESAQGYAEWWLSAASGAHATVGTPCKALLSVQADTTQVCSNQLVGNAATVPWMNNSIPVGVGYKPAGLSTSGADLYYKEPLFYIAFLDGSYDKASGTQINSYRIDAAGYGGTANAVSVVESAYRVSVTYTTQNKRQKFYSLTGP